MNFREKLTAQTVVCLMIFSAVKTAGMLDFQAVKDLRMWTEKQLSTDYTLEQLGEAASELLNKAGKAHEAVTAAVTQANLRSASGEPLGEADSQGIQVVYAVSGGDVVSAGISDEYGMYVRIRQEEKISVYGNLSDVAVLTGERVRKGDIIGSYDSSGGEFIFETSEEDFSSKISA